MSPFRQATARAATRLGVVFIEPERCMRAVLSNDSRFDGQFVTAVVTTGIYCRPSCPVPAPKPENMRFLPTAAAAQAAGFRACKRCRPDAAPGSPEWDARADLVARALRLIADGVIDREGVDGLASRLGYSRRQLQRQMAAALGAGPLAIARSHRAQAARVLLETTTMQMSDIAFAAGFGSVRQFNDTMREVFAVPPSTLRNMAPRSEPWTPGTVTVRLALRRPFWPDSMFSHLIATAIPGVEEWRDGAYRRSMRLPFGPAIVALTPQSDHISCRLTLADMRDFSTAITRCRRLLDLDADPTAVDTALSKDCALARLVESSPGRRIPRTVDEHELALRVLLSRQVNTRAARTRAQRLVALRGKPIEDPHGTLTHVFPTADAIADVDPATLPVPASRRRTLSALAQALADSKIDLSVGADWDAAREGLAAIPGIDPWSTSMIAMRALGDPDAFPPADFGLQLAASALRLPPRTKALERHAQRWRPWRAYAAQYLWGAAPGGRSLAWERKTHPL